MTKNIIDGFFYSLGVVTDKAGFQQANDALTGLKKTALSVAAAVGAVSFMGKMDQELLNVSADLGIGTAELEKWGAAAGRAGASAQGFIDEMQKLQTQMNNMDLYGEFSDRNGQNLENLGINAADFRDMSADDRLKAAWEGYMKIGDVSQANSIIEGLFGSQTSTMFATIRGRNKDLSTWLAEAGNLIFGSEKDKQATAELFTSVMDLMTNLKGFASIVGGNAAEIMNPKIEELNKWLSEHADDISAGIDKTFEVFEKIVDGLGKFPDLFPSGKPLPPGTKLEDLPKEEQEEIQGKLLYALGNFIDDNFPVNENVTPYSELSEAEKKKAAAAIGFDGVYWQSQDGTATPIKPLQEKYGWLEGLFRAFTGLYDKEKFPNVIINQNITVPNTGMPMSDTGNAAKMGVDQAMDKWRAMPAAR